MSEECVRDSDCLNGYCEYSRCFEGFFYGEPCNPRGSTCHDGFFCHPYEELCLEPCYIFPETNCCGSRLPFYLKREQCTFDFDCVSADKYCLNRKCRNRAKPNEDCSVHKCPRDYSCVKEESICRLRCSSKHSCPKMFQCWGGVCIPGLLPWWSIMLIIFSFIIIIACVFIAICTRVRKRPIQVENQMLDRIVSSLTLPLYLPERPPAYPKTNSTNTLSHAGSNISMKTMNKPAK